MLDKVSLEQVNTDFDASVSMADFAFEFSYPLELTTGRFTALMKLSSGDVINTSSIRQTVREQVIRHSTESAQPKNKLNNLEWPAPWQGFEALVLEGKCSIDNIDHKQGSYIRIPDLANNHLIATSDCILYVKLNQFLPGDTGTRVIDTTAYDKWLPGPVDGIEIRPLHVFDTESIMLLRWQHAAEFRPKLNPRGEEILVINGLLQNRDHLYRQYSWIRNPIEDWRKWHGNTGTVAYYKSGHFPDDPARLNPPDPHANE